MPKKILILTSDAGFGHRSAAKALQAALQIIDPDNDAPVVNPADNPDLSRSATVLAKLAESGYDQVVTDDPTLYQIAYRATDAPIVAQLIQDFTTTVINDTMENLIRSHAPDAVVITFPAFTQAVVKVAKKLPNKPPIAVIVTDLINVHSLWFHKGVDLTFAPTGHVYKQALEFGLTKEKVKLDGMPVQPKIALDERSKSDLREALGWHPELPTALIVGSTRTPETAGIARLLDRSGLELQIAVVAGGDAQAEKQLRSTKWRSNVHTYGFVKNMPDLMRASDFIICKAGGLIVSESLAAGLPLILHEALPGQEVGNVRYVVESGAGVWAPGQIAVLATTINWLSNNKVELKKVRAAAKKAGKPRASMIIAERLLKRIEEA